jgi:hypothetical protein
VGLTSGGAAPFPGGEPVRLIVDVAPTATAAARP